MSIENEFIPMPEAQTSRIRTLARLPFGMEKEIGINVSKIHQILQLGGVSTLWILSDDDGEKSTVDTSIVGFDGQGNALAGKSKVNYVPTSSSNYILEKDNVGCKQARWIDMSVTLNNEELKQRLLMSGKKVNEPENWSIEIDKSLKKEINKNCSKHLLGNFSTTDKVLNALFYSMDILSSMDMGIGDVLLRSVNPHPPSIPYLLVNIAFTGVWFTFSDSFRYGFEGKGIGRRISSWYGFEIDRLALLLLKTKTSLVKKLDKN